MACFLKTYQSGETHMYGRKIGLINAKPLSRAAYLYTFCVFCNHKRQYQICTLALYNWVSKMNLRVYKLLYHNFWTWFCILIQCKQEKWYSILKYCVVVMTSENCTREVQIIHTDRIMCTHNFEEGKAALVIWLKFILDNWNHNWKCRLYNVGRCFPASVC